MTLALWVEMNTWSESENVDKNLEGIEEPNLPVRFTNLFNLIVISNGQNDSCAQSDDID